MRRRSSCKAKWKDVVPPSPPPTKPEKDRLGTKRCPSGQNWPLQRKTQTLLRGTGLLEAASNAGRRRRVGGSELSSVGMFCDAWQVLCTRCELRVSGLRAVLFGIQIPSLCVHREDIAARRRSSLASASTSVGDLSTAAFSEP